MRMKVRAKKLLQFLFVSFAQVVPAHTYGESKAAAPSAFLGFAAHRAASGLPWRSCDSRKNSNRCKLTLPFDQLFFALLFFLFFVSSFLSLLLVLFFFSIHFLSTYLFTKVQVVNSGVSWGRCEEHRDFRDRLALRNAQRTAQRCLRELHLRFLRQRKAGPRHTGAEDAVSQQLRSAQNMCVLNCSRSTSRSKLPHSHHLNIFKH